MRENRTSGSMRRGEKRVMVHSANGHRTRKGGNSGAPPGLYTTALTLHSTVNEGTAGCQILAEASTRLSSPFTSSHGAIRSTGTLEVAQRRASRAFPRRRGVNAREPREEGIHRGRPWGMGGRAGRGGAGADPDRRDALPDRPVKVPFSLLAHGPHSVDSHAGGMRWRTGCGPKSCAREDTLPDAAVEPALVAKGSTR